MAEFKVGDRVEVSGKDLKGEIAFIGTTDFAAGKWIGETEYVYFVNLNNSDLVSAGRITESGWRGYFF